MRAPMKGEMMTWREPKRMMQEPLRRIVIAALMILICLSLYLTAMAQQGGTANYFYDNNGRLHIVLSPTGEAVVYEYDPAGNFTSVTRRAANELSILDFTPGAGGAGTSVTIYGTGYNTTPSANTVRFNGVAAAVTAATKTQLTVTVPTGATTGPITVINTNGTINSSENFFIAGNLDFSLPIAFGGSVPFIFNDPGSSPLTNVGILRFDGIAGQRVSLIVEDVDSCFLGRLPGTNDYAQVSIISPTGATLTTVLVQDRQLAPSPALPVQFGYIDSLALPQTGEYTILIDPNNSLLPVLCGGTLHSYSATARLSEVPPDINGTITASGLPTPVTFNAPGQNVILTFDGVSGQRIALSGSQNPATQIGTDVRLYSPGTYPSGAPLISGVVGASNFFVDTTTLTASGKYTILVDPRFNKTLATVLTLYDVPPDVAGTLVIGNPSQTITIPSIGQAANLTFNVPISEQVTVHIRNLFNGPLNSPSTLTLSTQSGTQIFTQTVNANADYDIQQTLSPGTYVIKMDPAQMLTGSFSIYLTTP